MYKYGSARTQRNKFTKPTFTFSTGIIVTLIKCPKYISSWSATAVSVFISRLVHYCMRENTAALVLCFIGICSVLNTQYHAASIKVPVFSWQFIQCSQRPLQGLQGPRRCHWVLVSVWVLLTVAVQGQVAPEHIDSNAELKSQRVVKPKGWKTLAHSFISFHLLLFNLKKHYEGACRCAELRKSENKIKKKGNHLNIFIMHNSGQMR